MSEEREAGSGFGPFVLGLAMGAVLGLLFAPETGEKTRGKVSRRLRGLRELAAEKASDVRQLLEQGEGEEGEGEGEGERQEAPTAREELERRLAEARRRRREGRALGSAEGEKKGESAAPPRVEAGEEDEPVA